MLHGFFVNLSDHGCSVFDKPGGFCHCLIWLNICSCVPPFTSHGHRHSERWSPEGVFLQGAKDQEGGTRPQS